MGFSVSADRRVGGGGIIDGADGVGVKMCVVAGGVIFIWYSQRVYVIRCVCLDDEWYIRGNDGGWWGVAAIVGTTIIHESCAIELIVIVLEGEEPGGGGNVCVF